MYFLVRMLLSFRICGFEVEFVFCSFDFHELRCLWFVLLYLIVYCIDLFTFIYQLNQFGNKTNIHHWSVYNIHFSYNVTATYHFGPNMQWFRIYLFFIVWLIYFLFFSYSCFSRFGIQMCDPYLSHFQMLPFFFSMQFCDVCAANQNVK